MKEQMKTAVMTKMQQIEMQMRPIPQPKDDEVLVKLEAIGVCGSDLHFFEHGKIGDCVVEYPFVLGHEPAGRVVEVGKNVTHLKVGDRVTLEPGKTCGKCEFCRTGRYNLCPDVEFFATPPYDGVLSEYVAHEAALCFKLPDNVDSIAGSLIEPLAVGFHAVVNQAEAHVGQSAVVFGAGCIGLVTLMALKYVGISQIFVVDVLDNRLKKAKELGAAEVLNAKKTDVVKKLAELTGGRGCDLAFETAGTQITAGQAIRAVKKGATIVLIGYSSSGEMNLPMGLALDKEINFKTNFRYRHIYPMAIEAVASGKVPVKDIVTDYYHLDQAHECFMDCINNKAEIVKAVITVD